MNCAYRLRSLLVLLLLIVTPTVGCGGRTDDPRPVEAEDADARSERLADAGPQDARVPPASDAAAREASVADARARAPEDARAAAPDADAFPARGPAISLAITPRESVLMVGAVVAFSVVATYADGTTADVSAVATYTPSDATVLRFTGPAATARAVGTSTVTASFERLYAFASVIVAGTRRPIALSVAPALVSCSAAEAVSFRATATSNDAGIEDVTARAVWQSSMPSVVEVVGGMARCVSAGTAVVSATFGGARADATVDVKALAVKSYSVEGSGIVQVGGVSYFSLRVEYQDGSVDYPSAVTWSSSDASIARTPAGGGTVAEEQVFGVAPGYAVLTAKLGGAAVATLRVAVSGGVLQSLAIAPARLDLTYPATGQIRLSGTYSDGIVADLTAIAVWEQATTVVSVQNGVVTPVAAGTSVITAHTDRPTISATAQVTVLPGTPTALEVSGEVIAPVGIIQSVFAYATYAAAGSLDVSNDVTWSVADTTVASITAGACLGVKPGQTTYFATLGMLKSVTSIVSVSNAVLLSLDLSATHLSLNINEVYELAVNGTFDDNTQPDVTPSATITTGQMAIAVAEKRAGGGWAIRAVGPGTTSLTATVGSVSTTTTVTVLP